LANAERKEAKDMVAVKIYHILRDIVEVLRHHDAIERAEIKTGLGIYHKDEVSHVHIAKGFKDNNA
jgi:hypothetical protein